MLCSLVRTEAAERGGREEAAFASIAHHAPPFSFARSLPLAPRHANSSSFLQSFLSVAFPFDALVTFLNCGSVSF